MQLRKIYSILELVANLNQKGIVHIFGIFILLAGIITGVYLVQHPQIFKPKAMEYIDPFLYQQRIDNLKETFKISDDLSSEQVQLAVKEDLLKSDIIIEGDTVQGDATVSVQGDCLDNQQTNYEFSEYGAFPPLCLSDEQKEKAVEFVKLGAESAADFVVPYSQAKQALEFREDIANLRDLLNKSGIADRNQLSSVSGPDSATDGYIVTLIRLHELEQDVSQNPDGSGKLTGEQEEARREYLGALRNLWEKQHNILFGLASATALSLIDKPLKIVGEFARPVTGPLVAKAGETKNAIFDFLTNSWEKLTRQREIGLVADSTKSAYSKFAKDSTTALRFDQGFPGGGIEEFEALSKLYRVAPDNVVRPIELIRKGDEIIGYKMEYVDGITVGEYIEKHGGLPADIRDQIISTLQTFHENNLAHGDPNFNNMIVTLENKVKFIDPVAYTDFKPEYAAFDLDRVKEQLKNIKILAE